MSDDIELVNAGEYLNKLCADMSASKSYYYDIQYTLSTTLLEYRLKHNLTLKDMASYVTDTNVNDGIKKACEHFEWI